LGIFLVILHVVAPVFFPFQSPPPPPSITQFQFYQILGLLPCLKTLVVLSGSALLRIPNAPIPENPAKFGLGKKRRGETPQKRRREGNWMSSHP
jgi:hypothetical protein